MGKHWVDPKVELRQVGGAQIRSLSGDWTDDLPLDLRWSSCAELEQDLPDQLDLLVMDLSAVSFLGPWGARHVLWFLKDVLKSAPVAIVPPDTTGYGDELGWEMAAQKMVLPTFDTVDQALADYRIEGCSEGHTGELDPE